MIINAYSKSVYNIALNFIADRDMASDITQDIFIKVFGNIGKYKEEKNFTSWLFKISRNYCIDYWRKNRKHLQTVEVDEQISQESPTPEDEVIRQSEIRNFRQKILQLDPELRIFLTMRDILNLSYHEIAERFSIPEGTVKSRINRARLKLTELIYRGEAKHGLS